MTTMLSRIEKIISPDDIAAIISLIVFATLIAMTAINWLSFWGVLA